MSSIYVWYRQDFGGSDDSVTAHLRAYAAPGLSRMLESVSRIYGDIYNRRLNDAGANVSGPPLALQ